MNLRPLPAADFTETREDGEEVYRGEMLRVQRDAGKTIIIAAHNTCLIAAADHVVRMEGGGVAD